MICWISNNWYQLQFSALLEESDFRLQESQETVKQLQGQYYREL